MINVDQEQNLQYFNNVKDNDWWKIITFPEKEYLIITTKYEALFAIFQTVIILFEGRRKEGDKNKMICNMSQILKEQYKIKF